MTQGLRLPAREIMTLEYAGGVILDAIRRKKAFVAFPRKMVWRVRMLRYLPRAWSDWHIFLRAAGQNCRSVF